MAIYGWNLEVLGPGGNNDENIQISEIFYSSEVRTSRTEQLVYTY